MRRPATAGLRLRVYGRALHPELLELYAERRVRSGPVRLFVGLVPAGHVVEIATDAGTLTECLLAAGQPLPGRFLVERHCDPPQRAKRPTPPGVYQSSVQVERLDPPGYEQAHAELTESGRSRGFFFEFRSRDRLGLAPLSHVTADPVPGGLAVTAFHTFPEELAVVKTQSLLEFA